ncbi:hypothetical protein A8U91_03293 [Halomonas elongata]|uniref:Uncharacterized protein n=1 Tax=Halomonas elongata TaxID=2746 RepID=A0A1B8NW59_HALEL|nr:hypothetical protein A8U91_03293 [Halomonas elongata]
MQDADGPEQVTGGVVADAFRLTRLGNIQLGDLALVDQEDVLACLAGLENDLIPVEIDQIEAAAHPISPGIVEQAERQLGKIDIDHDKSLAA